MANMPVSCETTFRLGTSGNELARPMDRLASWRLRQGSRLASVPPHLPVDSASRTAMLLK